MSNVVRTEFEVDASKAFSTADQLKQKYTEVDKLAGKPAPTGFANSLDQGMGKLNQLVKDLAANSALAEKSGSRVWQGYSVGAKMASDRAAVLRKELSAILLEANRTTDPKALKILDNRLAEVNSKADALQRKLERVNAGRMAAAGGGPISTSGLQTGLGAAAGAGVPFAAEAAQSLALAEQAGVVLTTTTAAIGIAGAAAAGAVYLATAALVKEANTRLKSEERVSLEYGRQQKILNDIRTSQFEFERQRAKTVQDTVFTKDVSDDSRSQLEDKLRRAQAEKALAEERARVNAITRGSTQVSTGDQKRIDEAAARITQLDAALVKREADTSQFLSSGGIDYKARSTQIVNQLQKDISKAEKDVPKLRALLAQVGRDSGIQSEDRNPLETSLQKTIKELVKEGTDKAKEFTKNTETIFEGLKRQAAGANPFVTVILDADKAMKTLRESTKGVSKDLQETFARMQQAQNALKLFETRVDNNLGAVELRQRASDIRRAGDKIATLDTRGRLDAESRGEFFSSSQSLSFIRDVEAFSRKLRDETIRASANPGSLLGGNTTNRDSLFQTGVTNNRDSIFQRAVNTTEQMRQFIEDNKPDTTASDRINAQFKVLTEAGAKTEEEKALIDRKILGLAGSDPASLSAEQRNVAAAAAEREAVRKENYERTALKTAQDHLAVSQSIFAQNKTLFETAQKQGIKGVDAIITVKDETEAGIRTVKQERATQDSTKSLYGGLGFAGGTNQ